MCYYFKIGLGNLLQKHLNQSAAFKLFAKQVFHSSFFVYGYLDAENISVFTLWVVRRWTYLYIYSMGS